jgi:hypothetical protein
VQFTEIATYGFQQWAKPWHGQNRDQFSKFENWLLVRKKLYHLSEMEPIFDPTTNLSRKWFFATL